MTRQEKAGERSYRDRMPLTAAEKMQNLRERRKKAGLCVICGQRKARKARVTCQSCADRAKKLVKKSRERAKEDSLSF